MLFHSARWHKVLDDLGEITEIYFDGAYVKKPAFIDNQPALKGFIRLPDGDVYRAWWPVFTDWWPEDVTITFHADGTITHEGQSRYIDIDHWIIP